MAEGSAAGEQAFGTALLRVRVDDGGEGVAAVVAVAGELDLANASGLGASLAALLRAGRDVVVDMRELRFADSSGLAALVRARDLAHFHRCSLTLSHVQPNVAKTMATAGLAKVFDVAT
jgi:anti-sigma B factor antagonist